MNASTDLQLWAATSGWEGPFQHEEVIVVAADAEGARVAAEAAFAEVVQPVCRAKMRIAHLGAVREGAVAGPRRNGQSFTAGGLPVELRCGE